MHSKEEKYAISFRNNREDEFPTMNCGLHMRFQGFEGSFPASCVLRPASLKRLGPGGKEGVVDGDCGHHRDAIEGC